MTPGNIFGRKGVVKHNQYAGLRTSTAAFDKQIFNVSAPDDEAGSQLASRAHGAQQDDFYDLYSSLTL